MKNLYLSRQFFIIYGGIVVLFVSSFSLSLLFPVAQTLLVLAIIITIVDISLLFGKNTRIKCRRQLPKVFSLGDANTVTLIIRNASPQKLSLTIIDELPFQFQNRDFEILTSLEAGEKHNVSYQLTPVQRGEYTFGCINIYIASFIGMVQRRVRLTKETKIPVYPSILQMKRFELKAVAQQKGIKNIRRIGHSYEFEQIKNYVRGDDYRSINWKASSRRSELMVNQYEDERAQQVYCIIDKSRSMKLPFHGMSLMDYAINTSLVISNIVLQKYDKAGLFTFSNKIGATIKADRKVGQLNKILLSLYREKERQLEPNYELLYHVVRKLINGRSLLLLYTNFESMYALDRVLPILRRINQFHLLVVIFFENTEIGEFVHQDAKNTKEIYYQTVGRKFLSEKNKMKQKLSQYGIQTILTAPEELSVNAVNKYLELKSRGLI